MREIINISLADVIEHTKKELDKVASMRKKLGLAPLADKVKFQVGIYSDHALASASINEKGEHYIKTNILSFALRQNNRDEYRQIMRYFDMFKEATMINEELAILDFVFQKNPDIEEFLTKKVKEGEQFIKKMTESYNERGLRLDEDFDLLNEKAGETRKNLEEVFDEVKELYKQANILPSLLHEVDHVDMMDTKMFRDMDAIGDEVVELRKDLEKNSKEYAEKKFQLLEMYSEFLPLIEIRGIVQNRMAGDINTLKADAKGIAEESLETFIEVYVEGNILESTKEALVAKEWADGNMDRETSNYISYMINTERNPEGAKKHMLRHDKINYDLAEKVFKDIHKWQQKFIDNGVKATGSSIRALIHNPAGFEKAREAETLDEYIKILQEEPKNANL